MLIEIKNTIFNMSKYDTVRPLDANKQYGERIAFFIESKVVEYAPFETRAERDYAWQCIKERVNNW